MVAFAQPVSRSNSPGIASSSGRPRPRIGKYPYPRLSPARLGRRFYNCYRWISRDPLGTDAGINAYAYADNRPIDGVDFLGLWSEIQRNKSEDRAKVCASSDNDTWTSLAQLAGLDPEQYLEWVRTPEGGRVGSAPVPGASYEIPNVIYISAGSGEDQQDSRFRRAAVWLGLRSGTKEDFVSEIGPITDYWEGKNFRVLRMDNVGSVLRSEVAHAWIFNGHGFPSIVRDEKLWFGAIQAEDGGYVPREIEFSHAGHSYRMKDMHGAVVKQATVHHKLAFAWIIGCQTARGPWESIVSKNGWAYVYPSRITGPGGVTDPAGDPSVTPKRGN